MASLGSLPLRSVITSASRATPCKIAIPHHYLLQSYFLFFIYSPQNLSPTDILYITWNIRLLCEKLYKWSHFKMELEPPSQRNCFACLTPQTFAVFELGKNNLWTGPKHHYLTTVCKANRKADNLTIRTKN